MFHLKTCFPDIIAYCTIIKSNYVMELSLFIETFLSWELFCHVHFKCGNINFHKQRKQPPKYQHLGINSLIDKNLIWQFHWSFSLKYKLGFISINLYKILLRKLNLQLYKYVLIKCRKYRTLVVNRLIFCFVTFCPGEQNNCTFFCALS